MGIEITEYPEGCTDTIRFYNPLADFEVGDYLEMYDGTKDCLHRVKSIRSDHSLEVRKVGWFGRIWYNLRCWYYMTINKR